MVRPNKKSSNIGQSNKDVMRTIRKSCEKAKNKRTRGGTKDETIVRTISLPIARATSANSQSSSNTNTDNDEAGSLNEERLELGVNVHDTSILGGSTPKRSGFIKDSSIKGIKSRLGTTPKRFDDRGSTYNANRHGSKFRENALRHEYVTKSDIDMLEDLNRNSYLYDVNAEDLAKLRSITLKTLTNMERIYRKIRRGNRYSHYPAISRNIQRNFQV